MSLSPLEPVSDRALVARSETGQSAFRMGSPLEPVSDRAPVARSETGQSAFRMGAKPPVSPLEPVSDRAPMARSETGQSAFRMGAKPPVVVLACKVLQTALARLLPPDLAETVTFMDYGLHRVPNKLTHALQEALDAIAEPSLVVLGYGLCGNGLKGLRAGPHTLLVPRTDDCIAILLGSYKMYMRQFGAVPGTYYLTKGWLESGSNPLQEYNEYVVKYGPKDAVWLVDQQYQHYERVVLVAPNQAELDAYRSQAQEVARFCERWGWRYEEILGSDDYVQRLIEAAAALGDHHQPPDWINTDFVVILPGGEIRQEMFMR